MTHIQRMLLAKDKLPPPAQRLFDALFLRGLSVEAVCEELGMTPEQVEAGKGQICRDLKAAVQ